MQIQQLVWALFLASIVLLTACDFSKTKASASALEMPEQELTGLELSKQYCRGCHQYPAPGLLDKKTWQAYILPRMGYMLGIYENDTVRASLFEAGIDGQKVKNANIFPAKPLIEPGHWQKIVDYYLTNAPDELETPAHEFQNANQFEIVVPNYRLSPPSTTMVHFTDNGEFYIGDANSGSLMHFNASLNLLKAGKVPEGAVHIHETSQALWITVMGSFSPTDAPSGMLLQFPKEKGRPAVVIDSLQRPVHSSFADLDQDGLQDVVISEFGKWTGGLSWWKQNANGTYTKNRLSIKPGAIRTQLHDMDQDGLLDIVALFGQGDEGIFLYRNLGNGQFKAQKVLDFPSSYGSTYFELFDYNNDEHLDILYTAGDNGDYPPLMKPYHGIRVFENKGNEEFNEILFLPLNGAYKAIPYDFDGDGDMDIAAISFFPDFQNRPEEGFVFFKNQGNFDFQPQVYPKISDLGRWLIMDSADWDQDGDMDLILGALTFEVVPKMNYVNRWVENGIPFIIMKNLDK